MSLSLCLIATSKVSLDQFHQWVEDELQHRMQHFSANLADAQWMVSKVGAGELILRETCILYEGYGFQELEQDMEVDIAEVLSNVVLTILRHIHSLGNPSPSSMLESQKSELLQVMTCLKAKGRELEGGGAWVPS